MKRIGTSAAVGILLAAAVLPYWVFGQGGEIPAGFPPPARTPAGVPLPGSRIQSGAIPRRSSAPADSTRMSGATGSTPAVIRPKKSGRKRVRRRRGKHSARRRSKRRGRGSRSRRTRRTKKRASAKSRFPAERRQAARKAVELPVIPLSAMAPQHP